MNSLKIFVPAVLIVTGFMQSAQANLTDNGNSLVYDSVLNITWMAQNNNLFKDMTASNANLINDIIAANNGVIYDSPSDTESGGAYSLTSSDFSTYNGTMDWWGAEAWIGYLNSIHYDGFNDWSLPTTANPVSGYNQAASEMGALYYTALGLTAGTAISTSNPYYYLFSNLAIYWSASEYSSDTTQAWYFNTLTGDQSYSIKDTQLQAFAILPGDAVVVPVPGANWLFLSSFGFLIGMMRSFRNFKI
jgi:hypothetical protein